MNKVALIGRLTKDPDIRYSQGEKQTCIANFTLAVDRRFKREGEPDADFIRCVAFGKIAEHIERYYYKGIKVAITGRIQTGSYKDREDRTIYTTDIVVEESEFAESKAASEGRASEGKASGNIEQGGDFINIPDDIEGLPFS